MGPIKFLKANLAEFWEFAFKGNLISLAIGVVLGGAFGALIKSFVDNIFMPIISLFSASPGGAGYTRLPLASNGGAVFSRSITCSRRRTNKVLPVIEGAPARSTSRRSKGS